MKERGGASVKEKERESERGSDRAREGERKQGVEKRMEKATAYCGKKQQLLF